jgi:hypothetical protein
MAAPRMATMFELGRILEAVSAIYPLSYPSIHSSFPPEETAEHREGWKQSMYI